MIEDLSNPSAPRPPQMSLHGVVAAAHPLAAQAGVRTLHAGGNAFDAAAAVAAALNVVEPFMSGLCGLGFATAWVAAERRVKVLDFTPPIPKSFPEERFSTRADMLRGPQAVMPPGNLAGWAELVRAHGRLSLADAFQPAIGLARNGFPVTTFGCAETNDNFGPLTALPALGGDWQEIFCPDGPIAPGHVLRQPELAGTLEAIARHGPDHLYRGPLGQKICAHLAETGGTLTAADLDAVRPVWREPLAVDYRGLRIHLPPPPCEGFQCLLALRILEGFDLERLERNGVDHLDTVLRAVRLAAGLRIAHNDPDPETLARLLSEETVAPLRERVRDGKPVVGPTEQWMPEAPDGPDPGHTTSFSIGDGEGNLVCVTQSLGSPFGSGVVVPGTGLVLNNFLYWADVQPGSPTRARPGANLAMCVSPTISLRGGEPVLALGTPGSYGILQTQVQALVQHVDFGLPLQAAIDAPRARLWDGRRVDVEGRIPAATVAALRERGHDAASVEDYTWRTGGMQAVARDPASGVMTGAADPRRDGAAMLA